MISGFRSSIISQTTLALSQVCLASKPSIFQDSIWRVVASTSPPFEALLLTLCLGSGESELYIIAVLYSPNGEYIV